MSLRSVALAQFAYGSGTVDDPYRVANQTHLDNVRTELDKHFLQTANITLSGNWRPIGTLASQFSGVYDGGNFSITSLNVVDGGNDRGLFGRAMKGSIIRNVSVSGLVSGGVWAGGLLGRGEHTIISNCFANVAVSSQENNTLLRVGGLVGRLGGTTSHGRALVQDSYAWGSVAAGAQGKAGGLVGQLVDAADIRNSYSIGPVSGGVAGGLIGEQFLNGDGSVNGVPIISNAYWNTQTSGQGGSSGGHARTTALMQNRATFQNWDFNDTWRIYENKSYPYLIVQAPTVAPLIFNPPGGASHDTNVAVTISSPTPDVTFHYLIDGDRIEPDETSFEAPANGVVNVPVPGQLAAVGWKAYFNPSPLRTDDYIGYVAEPVFDPQPGPTPGDSVLVTVTCLTPDAMIRYTTNGVDPTAASPFFSSGSQITISVPGTIKARAEKPGMQTSSVVTGEYTVAAPVDAPVFDPPEGEFSGTAVVVTVTSDPADATIHYWLNDGPTNELASGDQVSVPLGSGEEVFLRAMAFRQGMNDSNVSTGVYRWAGQVDTPTFTPNIAPDGVTNVVVTIMSETEESIQYYTVDGSIPTTNSPSVSNGGTVNVPVPGTLRAMAAKDGLDQSELQFRYFGSFAGGTGVAGAPYLVAIPEQLDNVRYYPTNHIRLIADIDLGQGVWTNGMGWQPIGHLANPFTGSFDGNGHTIDGLFISRTNQVDIGLFGYLGAGSRIANLGLLGGSVAGKDYVGALVGYSLGTISNCFATCSVDGVIGAGAMELGGVGGLVGYSSGLVRNSYALGAITGNRNLGGLVGSNAGSIIHAYSAGPIDPVENAGGLLGVWISGSIEHCFWDKTTSGISESGGNHELGKTTTEMQRQATFTNWNFNEVWGIVESNSYPYLLVLTEPVQQPTFNPDGGAFGSVTVAVTIASATPDAIIYYTTNGSTPTAASPEVPANGVVVIPVPSTLKAFARKPGMRDSAIKQANYTERRVATPQFDPPGGSFTGTTFTVSITCETTDAIIRYTTNGSDPTTNSPSVPPNGEVEIPVDATLKAKAWRDGWLPSLVAQTQYSPSGKVETPQFSPEGGEYDGVSLAVTITSDTTNATIRYTTDGTDPAIGSLVVPANGQVTIPLPVTLKAEAWKEGLNPSAIKTAYYGHFAGGLGTAGEPYLIALPGHLNKIRDYNHAGTVFRMIADIDLEGTLYTNWIPVGNYDAPFSAAFDGDGHVIRNLTIERPATDDIGLFGSLSASGVIRNLGILGGSVSGKSYVGGLVGWNRGVISNCFASCSVQNTGQVVGGLIGGNEESAAVIKNCYAKGAVSGGSQVGGLVGYNLRGTIVNTFSAGPVEGSTTFGGLVGSASGGSVTASFWDTQKSGLSSSAGGTPKTIIQMKQQATFSAWNFGNVWEIIEGQTYPFLQVLSVGGGDEQLRDWLYSYYSSVEDLPEFSVKGDPLLWEYIAGTDPTDPESLFAVSEAAGSASNLTLQVDSLTGRIYRLLSTPSLEALNWQPVGVAQEGTGGPLNLSAPAPTTRAFYRISVELAD